MIVKCSSCYFLFEIIEAVYLAFFGEQKVSCSKVGMGSNKSFQLIYRHIIESFLIKEVLNDVIDLICHKTAYQFEKIRLKISSVILRTISSAFWLSACCNVSP